jgi:hypothetical protein
VVRTYVLVSGECPRCDGDGTGFGDGTPCLGADVCPDCSGTGARIDVGAIARRYGGDGDARVARFEVRS